MKRMITLLLTLLMIALTISALALPEPKTAHYPRGSTLYLSKDTETNNTYAFKANGKSDGRAVVSFNNAYSDACDTIVTVQMFVTNKWGNWIAFGSPKTITLSCVPSSEDLSFTIRAKKEFCIKISAYGAEGDCVIPYQVTTK